MQTSKQPECEGVGKVILEKTPVPEYALKKIHAGSVEIVSSPLDNSEIDKISSLLASANNYLYIEQFYIDPWGAGKNPFLESAINAARNNAKVRILLDSTWYNVEDNDPKSNLVAADYANDIAKNESLDLEAKVYEGNLYEKIHSKVFFSDEISFISSINWNENSAKNNREIGLVVRGGDISNYYKPFFEADFEGRYPSRKPDEITGFISANSSIWIFVIVGVIALAVVILFLRNDKNGPRQS
ncbi:MAG: hypothetical protein HYW25_03120 [Candidatus Aenigmarchaeota archaeon]|nr:hypothetical protein [Candidatus Aenigmarchaeota archaeon]